MELRISRADGVLAGFGDKVYRVEHAATSSTLAFASVLKEDGEDAIWLHFPKPISKKKVKLILEALEKGTG